MPLSDSEDGRVTGLLGMTLCEWLPGDVPQEVKLSRLAYFPTGEIP